MKPDKSDESVILLHGLGRSHRSMKKIEKSLQSSGYQVYNCNYPSRKMAIEALAETTIETAVRHCRETFKPRLIHFVTHSMGGILIRCYLAQQEIGELGRIVMLAPPNAGSELVDHLSELLLFKLFSGPAGKQLGTDASSLPNSLGPVDYEVGIIAGNRSLNPFYSALIPGEDDGKISIRNTRLEGMTDFIVLPYNHSFMMNRPRVIDQTLNFLQQGQFQHPASRVEQ